MRLPVPPPRLVNAVNNLPRIPLPAIAPPWCKLSLFCPCPLDAGVQPAHAFPQIGIQEGHHYLTHEQEEQEACEKIAKIDRYYMQHFARFLERLQETPDADGRTLLYNSMIIYGSGIADANRHTHDNLPLILAGQGGGALQAGQYLQAGAVPMSNLYLSLLDRLGIEGVDRFGDSTGRLAGI